VKSVHTPKLKHLRALALVFVALPAAVDAQPSERRRSELPSAVVASVQIERENVFDRSDHSSWFARVANGLHMMTRERVVSREVLIEKGKPFDSASVAETARNLRRLGIFRDVSVDSVTTDSGLMARVITRDSWTTQVYTSVKSGGQQMAWGVGVVERNFLGSQINATARYTSDPDRSTTQIGVSAPRVWRNRLGLIASHQHLSDGDRSRFIAAAPFTSLSTRESFALDAQYEDAGVRRFVDGLPAARYTLRHLLAQATTTTGVATHASPAGFVRLGMALRVRRENFDSASLSDANRSVFGDAELSVEASRANFAVARGFRNLTAPEDIDLSATVRVGMWVAPSAWGYEHGGLGPTLALHGGKLFRNGFAMADVRASSLITRTGLDSGTVTATTVMMLQPAMRHSMLFSASGGLEKNARPGDEFDLGLTFGPRGFPSHAFTGNRAFFTMAEYRWVAVPEMFGLIAAALATFVDYGGAWYSGSPVRAGADAGVGVRVGSTRSSAGRGATRIDLARRFANDVFPPEWVVAVGAGFPFDRRR
jgi:hypothetical protein